MGKLVRELERRSFGIPNHSNAANLHGLTWLPDQRRVELVTIICFQRGERDDPQLEKLQKSIST